MNFKSRHCLIIKYLPNNPLSRLIKYEGKDISQNSQRAIMFDHLVQNHSSSKETIFKQLFLYPTIKGFLIIIIHLMGCCIPNQYQLGMRIALMLFKRVNRQRYRSQEQEVMVEEREMRVRLNSSVPSGQNHPSPSGYPQSAFRN